MHHDADLITGLVLHQARSPHMDVIGRLRHARDVGLERT